MLKLRFSVGLMMVDGALLVIMVYVTFKDTAVLKANRPECFRCFPPRKTKVTSSERGQKYLRLDV